MRLGDLDALKEIFLQDRCGNIFLPKHFVISTIDNAPTVDVKTTHDVNSAYDRGFITAMKEYSRPQGEWVSVSERLPIRNGIYNVTRIIDGTRLTDACYFDGQNTWHSDICVNHGRPYLNDIIAWQSLPEPYKEGGEEE